MGDSQTSVPAVHACGDAARFPHSVSLSVGDGAWAGAQMHQYLVAAPAQCVSWFRCLPRRRAHAPVPALGRTMISFTSTSRGWAMA